VVQNPYEAPRNDSSSSDETDIERTPLVPADSPWKPLPMDQWPSLELAVGPVKGFYSRSLSISGSINVDLKYVAFGIGERLYCDGNLVHTTDPIRHQNVAPVIEFNLFTENHYVPARIDVAASILKLLMVSRFKLTVAGRVIHQD